MADLAQTLVEFVFSAVALLKTEYPALGDVKMTSLITGVEEVQYFRNGPAHYNASQLESLVFAAAGPAKVTLYYRVDDKSHPVVSLELQNPGISKLGEKLARLIGEFDDVGRAAVEGVKSWPEARRQG